VVIERLIEQSKDVRFNEKLWQACKLDVSRSCHLSFIDVPDIPTLAEAKERNGQVIN